MVVTYRFHCIQKWLTELTVITAMSETRTAFMMKIADDEDQITTEHEQSWECPSSLRPCLMYKQLWSTPIQESLFVTTKINVYHSICITVVTILWKYLAQCVTSVTVQLCRATNYRIIVFLPLFLLKIHRTVFFLLRKNHQIKIMTHYGYPEW